MSAILELAIFPMDKGESVSAHVAKVVNVIKVSGLPHVTGPMGTCIEGAIPELMALCSQCFAVLEHDSDRIYATMKIDYRKGRTDGLKSKLESLAAKS